MEEEECDILKFSGSSYTNAVHSSTKKRKPEVITISSDSDEDAVSRNDELPRKRKRWRLVIHGAVDGYSRLITFLHCSNNNRSSTVLECFHSGMQEFGMPQRIRCDLGGENVKVAEFMLQHSNISDPVVVGSSVHNVRIERLWRDTFRCVLSVFYQLFYFLEQSERLNPLSDLDLFCLHFVYIPRINKALQEFSNGWNNHALTTECCRTPLQLYTSGSILHSGSSGSNIPASGNICSSEIQGIGIDVPQVQLLPTHHQMNSLIDNVNPLQESADYGIELYEAAKQFIN